MKPGSKQVSRAMAAKCIAVGGRGSTVLRFCGWVDVLAKEKRLAGETGSVGLCDAKAE